MTSPRVDQLVSSHMAELRHQAAQHRLARPVTPLPMKGEAGVKRHRLKFRLGSYLVELGQHLLISSGAHSPLA